MDQSRAPSSSSSRESTSLALNSFISIASYALPLLQDLRGTTLAEFEGFRLPLLTRQRSTPVKRSLSSTFDAHACGSFASLTSSSAINIGGGEDWLSSCRKVCERTDPSVKSLSWLDFSTGVASITKEFLSPPSYQHSSACFNYSKLSFVPTIRLPSLRPSRSAVPTILTSALWLAPAAAHGSPPTPPPHPA